MRTQNISNSIIKEYEKCKIWISQKSRYKKTCHISNNYKANFSSGFWADTCQSNISKYSFSYYEDEKVRGQFQQPLCVKYKFASAWCLL